MIKCPSFSGTEGVLRKLIFTTNVWLNNKLLKCFCLKKKKKKTWWTMKMDACHYTFIQTYRI